MKKIKSAFIFVLLIALVVSLLPAVAGAAPISLLSGKTIKTGSSETNYLGDINASNSVTDGNLSTGFYVQVGVSDSSIKDTLIYEFSTDQIIDSFKISILGYTNQNFKIAFLNASGVGIYSPNISTMTNVNGVYEMPSRLTGVRKVYLYNTHTAPLAVMEWDLYRDTTPLSPALTTAAGNQSVALNWSNVTDADSYTLKRSETPGGPYQVVADNLKTTSYSDMTVVNGTTYYYVVVGNNNEGTSPNSNEASATPTVDVPDAPTNLTAIGDNEYQSINLNWSSVTGAVYYDVKRSIVAGGPYTSIATNLEGTSYIDSDVVSGTTYYYVVTAINQSVGSQNSNEASAELEVPDFGRALLTLYISGGQIKEYDLSATQLSAFIDWYDTKDAGTGPAKYKFVKTWNKGPFKSRAEYVVFDKILTFDIDEYDVVTP
jgi:hypothetical protein